MSHEPMICTECGKGPLKVAYCCDLQADKTYCAECFDLQPCETKHDEGCQTIIFTE